MGSLTSNREWLRLAFVACLTFTLPIATTSCSDDSGLPVCVDGSPPGQTDGPRLTGAPTFAQSEIAPGTPVVLSVPVNGQTRRVFATISMEDSGGGEVLETAGGTTVEFKYAGPRVPGTMGWSGAIMLEGLGSPSRAVYLATDDLTTYEFSLEAGEASVPLCQTPFAPPTFVVVE